MLLSARFDLEEGTNPSLFQLGRLQCCTGFGPELFPDPSHGGVLYAICTCDVWLRIAMEDASEGSSSQWACQDK